MYQDLALCDNLDIVQNMFLGRETLHIGLLDETAMELTAKKTLAEPVGHHGALDPPAGRLALRRPAPGGRGRPGGDVGRASS